MTIYPLQEWGLGDIIFCQALSGHWIDQGHRVVWGVSPHFVEGLTRAYPEVTFLDSRLMKLDWNIKDRRPYLDGEIAPIRWADHILGVPYHHCMRAKYDMYGLDFNTWRDVKPERHNTPFDNKERLLFSEVSENYQRANKLDDDALAAVFNNGYNLISPYYGSGSQFKANIAPNNGLPNIYMTSIEGYSLFDWSAIIENATTIHAVSSSIVYLLELLSLNATEVHLYGRHHEPKTWYKNIEYILTKKYETH
jgi:hypothetical protein